MNSLIDFHLASSYYLRVRAGQIRQITLEDLQQSYARRDFDVLAIKTEFDVPFLRKKVEDLITKFGMQAKDAYQHYLGLGLHYHDETNPFFDSINSTDYTGASKKFFHKRNEASYQLEEIYEKFNSIKLSRVRILKATPGFRMPTHTDGAWVMNIHIPITTSENCLVVVDDQEYHLPADGSSYLVNATRPHYATNSSREDRIHIVFPIGPPSFRNLTAEEKVKYKEYYEMMGLPLPR